MLPVGNYATYESQEITGEDLLLTDTKEVDGKPIEPDKTYSFKSPVIHEKNHYRRLKRAYIKRGKEGIKAYLKIYMKDYAKLSGAIDTIFS